MSIPEPMESSTFSLRSNTGKSTDAELKWSEVQKSTLSLRPAAEEKKPKNIFEEGEEKLEGCEKVLESKKNHLEILWLNLLGLLNI